MSQDLEKIALFLEEHHVMSLATSYGDELSVCSLFYAYDAKKISFIVASSDDTLHIRLGLKNPNIAGNILLETKQVGRIQGVQFQGRLYRNDDASLEKLYMRHFPYALALQPKLWKIDVHHFKMTDNRLGFGKKILWCE